MFDVDEDGSNPRQLCLGLVVTGRGCDWFVEGGYVLVSLCEGF